jgi:hypothetical protein
MIGRDTRRDEEIIDEQDHRRYVPGSPALAAICLPLQAAGPSPEQMCEFSGGDFLSSGRKSHGYEIDRLARELPPAKPGN